MDEIIVALPEVVHLTISINHSTKICQNVFNWLYSWLESKVEMEEEYIISQVLLFTYVTHPNHVATLGHANCEKIIKFIREHVLSYEQNASFYRRIAIRHYDECTNSSIEGSFGGMKYSGMTVNPQHFILHSACILSLSSEIKIQPENKKWP